MHSNDGWTQVVLVKSGGVEIRILGVRKDGICCAHKVILYDEGIDCSNDHLGCENALVIVEVIVVRMNDDEESVEENRDWNGSVIY